MKIGRFSRVSSLVFNRPKSAGFFIFLILFACVAFIVLQRYRIVKENEHREMSNILRVVQQNINQNLNNCYTTTLNLALSVNDDGIPEDFISTAERLKNSNQFVDALQLVPDGVIKYVYPLKGNESVLGYDILKTKNVSEEAQLSIKSKKMYFAGPMVLKQGGIGVVGRLPIFKKNKFWGFSAVIISFERLLDASGINAIDDTKYYFQFAKENSQTGKSTFLLPTDSNFADKSFEYISIPEGNWKIYLINKSKYYIFYDLLPSSLLGLLFAVIMTIFLVNLLKHPHELQIILNKQARKLLSNEQKFEAIFKQAPVGIVHVDTHTGKLIKVNKKFKELIGYSFDELRNMTIKDVTHPDDLEENYRKNQEFIETKIRTFSFQKRYIHKNGDIIWINITTSPLWKKNEQPSTHISIIEDITKQKEADSLILKNKSRFKSLFNDSPIALWEEDFSELKNHLVHSGLIGKPVEEINTFLQENPDFVKHCISLVKIIDINNECLVLHYPKTKAELMTQLDSIVNDDAMHSFQAQIVAITQHESRLILESKVKKYDGNYRDISLRWSVMRGYEETLERVIISTEDITARKASEEIIIQSQKKLESLIDTIDGIVWECDYETYIFTYVNNKAFEITGYSKEEWMSDGNFWGSTIHPEDKEWVLNFCSINSKTTLRYDFEYRMIAKNGAIIWIRDIVNVIKENGKTVSLKGIMIDITKSKDAEKDLSNSFDLVSEQNKRLLNFSYIVSHNLRSHTSNIQSISSLIETTETERERSELIEMLKTVSTTLNETMFNLNEIVNIQTNINIIVQRLNLKESINVTLKILSEQIQLKNVNVKNNVSADIFVNYNPAYLDSVLLNFISNAIRYSDPKRTPEVKLDTFTEDGKTVLKISDNGIGIDLNRYGDKIFGMYKTFHANPDAKGIGLFITKNQIDAMEGKVTVESEPNVGTSFKIYFK